ncbi:HD domain-containing protein [Mycolicibacterium fortuitum]|uniref:HD domain-containing protein n=1 Tax=Mycolicibacterium fortuitum TaxID=1766 RepID=UPI001CE04194|nr:HD domain-containing protein [Mycolicibacterium fortuitum]MCA4725799.1 HD domain-containing protein [Mycolicibacterium fortuitum]
MESTTTPKLGDEFAEAMSYAVKLHATQTRKGGDIPYFGHLMSVSALVIEAGGSQTQAIAGLLHDAVEDQGGKPTLDEIESRFGSAVAKIVSECSDTDEVPKPPWRDRKERYIAHLRGASDDAVLVSLADKVDNARAILRDLRLYGDHLWQRFNVKDPQQHLWYYRSLLEVFEERTDSWLVDELRCTVEQIAALAGPTAHT